jgi:hypothetical protein
VDSTEVGKARVSYLLADRLQSHVL